MAERDLADGDLEACLPAELRGPGTTITRVAVGMSGAGVYRVDAGGESFVLKVWAAVEPFAAWRRRLFIQEQAAQAGLAPRVVHVDAERRAALSAFVVDRSFPALYMNPQTRDVALSKLGRALGRLHELPLPPEAEAQQPREYLAGAWSALDGSFALPRFASDAIRRVLAEESPASGRAPVLSHNDVNPTNLAYDGENVLFLDWDTAGPNDPFYDLAAIAVFMRMDDAACLRLLEAHDGTPLAALPPRFAYERRMVAALCGTISLRIARQAGHAGATGPEAHDATLSLQAAPTLSQIYERLRAGTLALSTPEGQWSFGLALLRTSADL